MTKIQLLKRLRESKLATYMQFKFKVVYEAVDSYGHELYIIVFNQLGYPTYLLKYRLDIDFLADFYEIGGIRMHSNDLKTFEQVAVSQNKDSMG